MASFFWFSLDRGHAIPPPTTRPLLKHARKIPRHKPIKSKIMIKIIAQHLRNGEKGQFVSLELQSGIELVQSQNSGRFYATVRKAFISTTFDEETAKSFIGQSLPGTLERVACDPYTYKVPGSTEEITLSHTYAYVPSEEKPHEADVEAYQSEVVERLR
jgi:hypothetical protein